MFARSQDAPKRSGGGSGVPQKPKDQPEQHSVQPNAADTRYANIAPRPAPGRQQQTVPGVPFSQPPAAPKGKKNAPRGKQKNAVTRQPKKPHSTVSAAAIGKSKAKGGTSKVNDSTQTLTSSRMSSAQPQPLPFEADDLLIQELLAGIPSTAWLPTDPLTSEGWFTDPLSSLIVQETAQPLTEQQATVAGTSNLFQEAGVSSRPGHSLADDSGSSFAFLQPGLATDMLSNHEIPGGLASSTNLVDAVGQQSQTTPDARLAANLRSKKETPLISRASAKKGNPLSGFAKKHGIGFPVGNQMAILSPALLSSSPPNAKQLRTHPYKYYSPPKPTQRPPHNQTKGRNLLFGRNSPLRIQENPPSASNDMRPANRLLPSQKDMHMKHMDSSGGPRSSRVGSIASVSTSTSTHASINVSNNPRGARVGVKWEIALDKLLLRGVRQQRWLDFTKPRDPNRFSAHDWDIISQGITQGSAVVRNSRQCRRRWAVMHAHLGTAIMDFVDSAPTPQSSAQPTPTSHGELTPDSRINDQQHPRVAPSHMRNLRLADLPMSSPPFMPAPDRARDTANPTDRACVLEEAVDSTRNKAHVQPVPPVTDTKASADDHERGNVGLSIESIDLSKRWSSPAYCQLLADVVQALTDSGSEAAAVVRKLTSETRMSNPTAPSTSMRENRSNVPETGSSASIQAAASLLPKTKDGDGTDGLVADTNKHNSQTMSSMLRKQTTTVRSKKEPVKKKDADILQTNLNARAELYVTGTKPVSMEKTQYGMAPDQQHHQSLLKTGGLTSKPVVAGALSKEIDVNPMDQDLSTYLEFLQSLTNDQGDLDPAWSTLFDDPINRTLPSLGGSCITGESALAASNPTLIPPIGTTDMVTASTAPVSLSGSAIKLIAPGGLVSTSSSNGQASAKKSSLPSRVSMDDDDANDGDFILNDSEEYDDEDEDDDEEEDEDDNDNDNDDEEGDDDDDEEDENSTSLLSKDGVVTEVPTMLLKPQQILAPGSETMLGASSSASAGDNAWNMTLEQLGLGAGSAAAFSSVLPDTASIRNGGMLIPNATAGGGGNSRNNERMLSSEELLQQLINGVSSDQRNNAGNMSIPCSMPTPSSASLSAWLPSGTDSSILSQWGSSGHNTGAGLDIGLVNGNSAGITQGKLTDELLANLSGPNALLPTAPGPVESGSASTGATQRSTSNIVTTCKPGKNTSLPTEASTSYAVNEKTGYGQKFQQNQRLQDLSASDLMSLARFGQGKTPRKRKKKAAASIAKALSAAAILDADGVMNLEQSGMDTEMSGLYQDALQEGEEIDVQEELLIADNSDYMFTAEQMSQLREQQVQNFQFVTQSFLITCAESGPHGARARHWKRQLDQLALWHSLGTRESPGDMMSSGGLQGFGDLIESAERVRARTGAVGMSESGRFAPNPVSFFAIPGITVVIPEIYEAVDEIHRTTQLCADSSNSDSSDAKGEQYSNDEDKETPRGSSAVPAAASSASEVRSFDGSMCFTSECKCTALKNGFKSAMVRECVFPKLHRQARVRKRKLSADRDSVDGKAQSSSNSSGSSGGGNKHIAIQPQDPAVLSARRNSVSTEQSGLNGGEGLAQLPGARSLAPLTKPVARQISIQRGQEKGVLKHGDGRAASTSSIASGSSGGEHGGGSALLTIMPMMVAEPPPTYTEADIRMIVEEMGAQMHGFKREVHRVPRSRRRIFVQGSDGVARLEWMKVKIEPLLLPATMQGLVDVMVLHSGFQEAMIPKIVVVRKPKNRIHFLDSEDSLLLQGLRLFGLEDVASIRVHLLPCKTASQLRNRMNNLRARRAPPNPVKDFCLRRIAPFTLEEEETLRLGVLVYGDEFKQLDKNFLINRPILALTHVWNHVRNRPSEASSSSPSLSMVKT